MKSFLGVSHLDYPNDIDGFRKALTIPEVLPMFCFFIPICSLLLTRGFDITWAKENSPPLWYGVMLAISGFGFPVFYFWAMSLVKRLNRKLKLDEETPFDHLLPLIYRVNLTNIWNLYYKIKYVGGIATLLQLTMMGWGISSIIYFAIGRV